MKRVILLGILSVLAACKPAGTAAPAVTAVPATLAIAESRHIKDLVVLDGTVAPSQQVNLIARVAGNLDAIHFKDGQWVKKGDLLFSIERPPYLDQVKLNQARLDQANSDYARQKELLKENANSETNVEISLSNLRQAEANVDIAKTNLSYTEVRAPFDGVMGKHQVDPGNYVGASPGGTVLATIFQIAPVFVNAAVGENEAIRIRRQQAAMNKDVTKSVGKTAVYAQLQGESENGEPGVLDFIDHQLNQTSGTVALRGIFPNANHHLIPGFYAKLTIEASDGRDAVVIKKAVVQTDQEGEFVYVVGSDNVAHRRAVHTALLPQENVEVTDGLKAGEKIVVEGYSRISDGLTVQAAGAAR
jgi:RND family efflux transporter MFP subunit